MFEQFSKKRIKQYTKDFIKSERAILLLCMSIALVFWIFVQLSQVHKTQIDIPLHVQIPKGQILKEKPPKSLKVTLTSKGWNLFYRAYQKQPKQLSLQINEDENFPYSTLQELVKTKISDKLDIINISPRMLSFHLDKFVKKQVPIRVNAVVKTVNQFQLSNKIQLLPHIIEITGPKTILDNITALNTELITVSDLRKNLYGEVRLLPQENKQVRYQSNVVSYMMTIEQFSEKTLTVPIIVENDSTNSIRLIPQTAQLTCSIGLSKYDILKPSDFQLSVDVYNLDLSQDIKLPISIKKQPNWINHVKIIPEYADFVIITNLENTIDDDKE